MSIQLKKIDRMNWENAIELPVTEEHEKYVASNVFSIAEAQFYPGVDAYAIYNADKMVGFAMFGVTDVPDEDDGSTDERLWVWRFMIAKGEQFKGYGKEAMSLIIKMAKEKGHKEIMLSTEPGNEQAMKFYESLGFKDTGEMQFGEEIFSLQLG